MNRFVMVLGTVVLVLTLLSTLALATQVLYRSPQQLGAESALVVSGKVADVKSYWNASGTKILTETSITVDDSYKGAAGRTVNVVQLGGVVGHVRMTVHGALSWNRGEEVLVFLEPFQDGAWRVSGFSQGKYNIVRDANGAPYIKNAPDTGVEIKGAPAATGLPGPARNAAVPLDDFINQALGRK